MSKERVQIPTTDWSTYGWRSVSSAPIGKERDMNRLQKTTAAVLVSVTLAIGASGCAEKATPTPEATARPTAAPTPTPTPVPTPTPDPIAEYTDEGWELLWQSDFSGAEAAFEMAAEYDEDAVAPYKGLALLFYYVPGRGREGLEAAEEAVALAPDDAEAHAVHALTLWRRYQYQRALSAAEKAVTLIPESVLAQVALARALLSLSRFDEALTAALTAVELDSGSAVAHHTLAKVYGRMQRRNDSLAHAHTAAALRPDFAPWWHGLAYEYYWAADDAVQARAYITEALSLAGDYAPALGLLAEIEADDYESERASALCEQIKELLPEELDGHLCQGYVYLAEESYDEAIAEYEMAVELEPASPWAMLGLAWAHYQAGDCDVAAAEYETLSEEFPWLAEGRYGLAVTAVCNGRPEEALVHAEEAMALDPFWCGYRGTVAWVHMALNEYDEAEVLTREAIEMDPKQTFLWEQLAEIATQQGREDEAIQHREHAVALDPDDGYLHYSLGYDLWYAGDFGRAIEHLEQARELGVEFESVFDILGLCLTDIGSYREAHQVLDEGLKMYPESIELRAGVGYLLSVENRCEEAIVEYEWVLERDPEHESALEGRRLCDQILNPVPTPAPAAAPPVAGGLLSLETASEQASAVIGRAGGIYLISMREEAEVGGVWVVAYYSQAGGGTAEFAAQQRQIIFGLSEIMVRLDPPVIALSVVAGDFASDEIVNAVAVLSAAAQAWVNGSLSDQDFVDTWYIETP
jgi:tetratricopeptide (TPR) repeat protein